MTQDLAKTLVSQPPSLARITHRTQKTTAGKPLSKGKIIPAHTGKVPAKPDKGRQIENYMLERYGDVI